MRAALGSVTPKTGETLNVTPAGEVHETTGAIYCDVPCSPKSSWVRAVRDGIGDEPLLVKYRITSRNEQHGNYILTAFLGVTLPTGNHTNGASHAIITPTIAAGKGWGGFDVQTTLGVGLPAGGTATLGRPISSNTTLQYRVLKLLWPEVEISSTSWRGGTKAGKNQVFVTPGLIVGRIPLNRRVALVFGGGFQIATTRYHAYSHAVVLTFRVPFK